MPRRDEVLGLGTRAIDQYRRHSDRDPDALSVKWSVVLQVIGYCAGLVIMWNAITNRVAVIETRVDNLTNDVREIKGDVKQLLLRR